MIIFHNLQSLHTFFASITSTYRFGNLHLFSSIFDYLVDHRKPCWTSNEGFSLSTPASSIGGCWSFQYDQTIANALLSYNLNTTFLSFCWQLYLDHKESDPRAYGWYFSYFFECYICFNLRHVLANTLYIFLLDAKIFTQCFLMLNSVFNMYLWYCFFFLLEFMIFDSLKYFNWGHGHYIVIVL